MLAKQQDQDLTPLLDAQQNQLSSTLSDGDAIDTKALAILAANIAMIIFARQTALSLSPWQTALLYTPFSLSLALDFIAIWPRRYMGPGVNPLKLNSYLNMGQPALLLQLLSDTQAAILHNNRLNKQRLKVCVTSIALTGFGFLALLFIL